MQISTILDNIDAGAIALPEFQRGYVWGRRQVRELFESLYRGFPVGSLLLWKTATSAAPARGDGPLQAGFVSLLLDGQQRVTSLYGIARGTAPPFFDGNAQAFTDLRFHPGRELFAFYAPVTMRDDPLWLDVTRVLSADGAAWAMRQLQEAGADGEEFFSHLEAMNRLRQIMAADLHAEEITGADKTVDIVVELFNRVNSAGTKLSKGDLALAKLCARWPAARGELKRRLTHWDEAGFQFSLDWLLRNVATVTTDRAELSSLADLDTAQFSAGLDRAERSIDHILNLASSRLGLDHSRVLGAAAAIPLMSRFVADHGGRVQDQRDADRLLFWYVHALLWGRYSGSTETVLNADLQSLRSDDPLGSLITSMRMQRGGELRVRAEDFGGWTVGARFYPLLYMLTRVRGARDLRTGLELRRHLLGQRTALEVHHLFPKGLLYKHSFTRPEVNALANFSFLTQETNRSLGDAPPAAYFAEVARERPGILASHWIPDDPALWGVDRYIDFLAARRELLATAANELLDELLLGRLDPTPDLSIMEAGGPPVVDGDRDERDEIDLAQAWCEVHNLDPGIEEFALFGLDGSGEEAILDLAWPNGLRFGGDRAALVLDESPEVHTAAEKHGYRLFANLADVQRFVAVEADER